MKKSSYLLAILVAGAVSGCLNYESRSASVTKPYPLGKTCVVSGHPIEGDGVRFVSNHQEVRLCCNDCRAEFDKNPAKFLAKLR